MGDTRDFGTLKDCVIYILGISLCSIGIIKFTGKFCVNLDLLINRPDKHCKLDFYLVFVRNHSDCSHKYSEVDIKSMSGFLIDNIYVVFGDWVFQQSIGIPMGTNCALLLADLLLYSYEAEFVQKLLRDNNKTIVVSFNHTFRYIDDVPSINNHNFHNYVHLIYPEELYIKDTT